jgi:hypothetical protein
MKTIRNRFPAVFAFSTALVAAACSASPEGPVASSGGELRAAPGGAGAPCDANAPCAQGFYCAPSPSSPACGPGTCVADPASCPLFETLGVCGCDGKHYLNANCASVNGTASEGACAIGGAQIADVAGTWSRVVSTNAATHEEVDETLVVNADATYELTTIERCYRTPGSICFHPIKVDGESAGTVMVGSNGGFLFQGSCAVGDCSAMATEFRLEHNCLDYAGALHIAVIEPPGSSEANTVYLEKR